MPYCSRLSASILKELQVSPRLELQFLSVGPEPEIINTTGIFFFTMLGTQRVPNNLPVLVSNIILVWDIAVSLAVCAFAKLAKSNVAIRISGFIMIVFLR